MSSQQQQVILQTDISRQRGLFVERCCWDPGCLLGDRQFEPPAAATTNMAPFAAKGWGVLVAQSTAAQTGRDPEWTHHGAHRARPALWVSFPLPTQASPIRLGPVRRVAQSSAAVGLATDALTGVGYPSWRGCRTVPATGRAGGDLRGARWSCCARWGPSPRFCVYALCLVALAFPSPLVLDLLRLIRAAAGRGLSSR